MSGFRARQSVRRRPTPSHSPEYAALAPLCALCVLLAALASGIAGAQTDEISSSPSLGYSGSLSVDAALVRNADFDVDEKDGLITYEPSVELELTFTPDTSLEALLDLQLSREYALRDEENGRAGREAQLEIDEFWVQFNDVFDSGTLRLGRQSISDEREWLYDKNLDGALLRLELMSQLSIELSASRERRFPKELLHDEDDDSRVDNYIASVLVELVDDNDESGRSSKFNLGAFAVARDDHTVDDEDPLFLSVLATGELVGTFDYWAQVGVVRGNDGTEKLDGHGFDVGGALRLDRIHDPYLLAGFAYGTGDKDTDDDTDRSFRQSGLQGNEARHGGLSKIKYYGELADPELSNLSIFTAGGGLRPTHRTSIEIVFHHYALNELTDELRNADIAEDPGGESKDIGDELDLIYAWQGDAGFELDLMFGYFMPGRAYVAHDNAYLAKATLTYNF